MPGDLSPHPSSPLARFAGQTRCIHPTDSVCFALARAADRVDLVAAYTAELAARARGRVIETQAIIDRLTRHG